MTRRLAPVPDTPPRVLGLVRVSKERDGMVSPEVQRTAIEDYCTSRGYEITGWLEGLDVSGSRARSAWWARLDQGIAAVEAGEYDVLCVWKFSRTARHRLKWAVALDRVETAGGRMESATEQVDVTTSTGRFTRGMLAELNAFEAERIGEVWKEVHARRVASGRPATGKPKWGYVYDSAQQLHAPDPVTGPVLAELYHRYVAGESVYSLVRWLNAHGHRTLAGGLWSDHTLRRVLDSGFAAGWFNSGGALHQGVHEPLIDAKLWQAYLDARQTRRALPARRERSQYLFSGLIRCARCGHPMVAGQFGQERQPKYRCKTGKEQGPEACAGGYITARFVERDVLRWLTEVTEGLSDAVDGSARATVEAQAHRVTARTNVAVLARQVNQAEEALARLAQQNAELPLPARVYRMSYDQLSKQIDDLRNALEDAQRELRAAPSNPGRVTRPLLKHWEDISVNAKRETLRKLIARIEVTTGRPRGTIEIVPTWRNTSL